ncbi:MAG TPA: cupin domain-containing protein [Flexivirga sp.]|uniref:cupin domain-containing protein n=1 Tax=Flexivirga sp. TaxID=1962927 RepID=UPI002B5E5ECE|nr:cupin domain-containing protein [Flexivirga sp.]HWC24052.1 cupin domain-containing protein [Flexivirga sp.]
MQRISLEALATQQLELAAAHSGRPAADTVIGGHERVLRQTVVGMLAGTELGEHNDPGEASVHVLRGRVRLTCGDASWEGRAGDLIKVPHARHSVQALEDSAILLTVAKLP